MVSEKRPDAFVCNVATAGVFVHANGKMLYLQNSEKPFEDYKWAIPGGKREGAETLKTCAARELLEETKIVGVPQEIGKLYIAKPHFSFTFHIFELFLDEIPEVTLSKEHQAYGWFSPDELLNIDLISGGEEVLQWYLNFSKG
ncbi:MAG: NUDIX hydrolase [Simkaniaceae bacterium]|nr:NUDIX hydrolase [Simkaniaceae bacterium]